MLKQLSSKGGSHSPKDNVAEAQLGGEAGEKGLPVTLQAQRLCLQRSTSLTVGSRTREKLPLPRPTGQSPPPPQAGVESPVHKVGRRLSSFIPAWKSITTDQFVLSILQNGYTLVFDDQALLLSQECP